MDSKHIRNPKQRLAPSFHPNVDVISEEEHIQELNATTSDSLPNAPKSPALPLISQSITPLINPNEYFIQMLMQKDRMREFFNIEEANEEGITDQTLGTYGNLMKQAGEQGVTREILDRGFNIKAAQYFALLHIYLKTEDSHGENILIRLDHNHHLIPTSLTFSRWLGEDPNHEKMLPKTTRWEKWPALSLPIDEQIKEFIIKHDPESFVNAMRNDFLDKCADQLSDEQKNIFELKFYHLKCNMIMVQEAVNQGLLIKQILALTLPVIDNFAFNFVTQGILKGGELWPARKRFATLHTGFKNAWNQAKKEKNAPLQAFTDRIKQEIITVKKIPLEILERDYFQEMCYELRSGLYL